MPSNVNLTTDTLTLTALIPSPLIGAHYPFKGVVQQDRWSAVMESDRWAATVNADRWSAVLLPTA